jgi:hypothetical protein
MKTSNRLNGKHLHKTKLHNRVQTHLKIIRKAIICIVSLLKENVQEKPAELQK